MIRSRRRQALAVLLVVLFGLGIVHLWNADRRISSIERYEIGGSMGYGIAYDVVLANGTEFSYSRYTPDHPDCPAGPVISRETDCPEDRGTERDDGFIAIQEVVRQAPGIRLGGGIDRRTLPVGRCLDTARDTVVDCPASPLQIGRVRLLAALRPLLM